MREPVRDELRKCADAVGRVQHCWCGQATEEREGRLWCLDDLWHDPNPELGEAARVAIPPAQFDALMADNEAEDAPGLREMAAKRAQYVRRHEKTTREETR